MVLLTFINAYSIWLVKTFALKNFKINNHKDVSGAFNILHYNNCINYQAYD